MVRLRPRFILLLSLFAASPLLAASPIDDAALERLITRSQSKDRTLRARALEQLGAASARGNESQKARILDRLLAGLEDPAWKVRLAACRALGQQRAEAGRARVPLLVIAHSDKDKAVRAAAKAALARVGPPTREQLPALTPLLQDQRWVLRRTALEALAELGSAARPALAAVLEATGDPDSDVRRAADQALEKIGVTGADFPLLAKTLKESKRPRARIAAIQRLQAWSGRTTIVMKTPRELSLFIEASRDQDWRVRRAACRAIGALKKRGERGFLALLDRSIDPDSDVREAAHEALGLIGSPRAPDVPGLMLRSAHANWRLRRRSVRYLGPLAKAERQAIPALLRACGDEDSQVRGAAEDALRVAGLSPADTEALCRAARGDELRARVFAIRALGSVGARTRESALRDKQIALCIGALDDPAWQIRAAACQALDRFDRKASAAFVKLMRRAFDDSREVRIAAAQALQGLKAEPKHIPELITALKDRRWTVRREAAQILGQIGRPSPEVIAALRVASKDSNEGVKRAAEKSLRALSVKVRWF